MTGCVGWADVAVAAAWFVRCLIILAGIVFVGVVLASLDEQRRQADARRARRQSTRPRIRPPGRP